MYLAQRGGAADQLFAVSQVCRKRFLDRLVVQEREHSVDDFAHAFRVKLTELAIDRHAAPDVNRSERGIRLAFFRLLGIIGCRRREYLELVGSAIQSQLESTATSFPFPAA